MSFDISHRLGEIRSRFAHVDACPFEGSRVYFENAGGALRLKSVIATSAAYAGYPDNQGRDNPASHALMGAIERGREDMRTFLNAFAGQVFVGESGTEVLFRLVRTASLGAADGGTMLGSTLEHPASRSAMAFWARITGRPHLLAPHDDATGTVTLESYLPYLSPELRVASIVHTSPVTGMSVDVGAISAAIRERAPDCFIIVDGIQHASHGSVDVVACDADGYALSPYKMFSRHGYGVGWASERLSACPKETVAGGSPLSWEQGTRDAGAYATFSDVVDYLVWLGGPFTGELGRRACIEAAGNAIEAHERVLIDTMMRGTDGLPGLAALPGIRVIGGVDSRGREGVVSFALDGMESGALVRFLREHGIRVHIRLDDHYCGNILRPLGLRSCVRVSVCHYNSPSEVVRFLTAMGKAVVRTAR